jgi:hypothetical protein
MRVCGDTGIPAIDSSRRTGRLQDYLMVSENITHYSP